MRRSNPSLLVACLLLSGLAGAAAAPLPAAQRQASIAYIHSLQNPDGGFRPSAAPAKSGLATAPAALRTLKYFGGTVRNYEPTLKFVLDCYDPITGGLGDVPHGLPDVRSTAMGLMALTELKAPLQEQAKGAAGYFEKNARALPEIYIAAAALDAVGRKPASASQWIAAYEATRSPEGAYGKTAPDTARAVNAILRLGGNVSDREAVVRLLKSAQRPDGGFSADGETSDLGTTYPVMRAFTMLKEKPNLARVRAFVARCRNADGGYGPRPGQPSAAGATYYAAIVLHWIDEMGA